MYFHSGEKPFKCKECGYKYTLRSRLQRHKRVYSGEKSFERKTCLYIIIYNVHRKFIYKDIFAFTMAKNPSEVKCMIKTVRKVK